MKRKQIIAEIVSKNIHYHFGIGHHTVPERFEIWMCKTLAKLDNVKLAQEARAVGIEIKAKDIN